MQKIAHNMLFKKQLSNKVLIFIHYVENKKTYQQVHDDSKILKGESCKSVQFEKYE